MAPHILTLSCPDRPGIVAAISGTLAGEGANIADSAQYGDRTTGRFFMRVSFEAPDDALPAVRNGIGMAAGRFGMDWQVHDGRARPRVLIMVSRGGHCLNDLLYRYRTGTLAMDVPAIVSNHEDLRGLAEWHDVPFHHLPIQAGTKLDQEQKLWDIIEGQRIDLVVLARYMQVLSPELCARLAGHCINIHHSFLPGFKGARPYDQAFARGVKLIGATAHYVTTDLDEGPIIEQEVERVDHTLSAEELAAVGRDTECVVLARAVKYHLEHRVLLNGMKTVVFR